MVKRSFIMELVDAAAGQKVSHFRTVKYEQREVKIFTTDSKIIMATFNGRHFEKLESRLRGPRESLLGFQGYVEEAIRLQSNAPLLSLCH